MSTGRNIQRAYNRAAARDRKRKPKMKVTGKSVFILGQLLRAGKRR
jgi:hypothetical protein